MQIPTLRNHSNDWLLCLLDHDLKSHDATLGSHSLTCASAFLESLNSSEIWAHITCDLPDPRVKKCFRVSQGRIGSLVRSKKRAVLLVQLACVVVYSNLSYLAALIRSNPAGGTVLFAINATMYNVSALQLYAWFRKDIDLISYFQVPSSRATGALGRFHKALRLRNMHYATEVHQMAENYSGQLGVACHVIPFPLPVLNKIHRGKRKASLPYRALFIGSPRLEKGIDTVVDALLLLRQELSEGIIEVSIQTSGQSENDSESEKHITRLQVLAAQIPNIRLLGHRLSEQEYSHAIQDCDFLLLPYRSSSYSGRSSGIAMEALAAGKPVVVTRGLTFSDLLIKSGTAVTVADGDAASLAGGVRELMGDFERYSCNADAAVSQIRKEHSVENIRALIFSLVSSSQPVRDPVYSY